MRIGSGARVGYFNRAKNNIMCSDPGLLVMFIVLLTNLLLSYFYFNQFLLDIITLHTYL